MLDPNLIGNGIDDPDQAFSTSVVGRLSAPSCEPGIDHAVEELGV